VSMFSFRFLLYSSCISPLLPITLPLSLAFDPCKKNENKLSKSKEIAKEENEESEMKEYRHHEGEEQPSKECIVCYDGQKSMCLPFSLVSSFVSSSFSLFIFLFLLITSFRYAFASVCSHCYVCKLYHVYPLLSSLFSLLSLSLSLSLSLFLFFLLFLLFLFFDYYFKISCTPTNCVQFAALKSLKSCASTQFKLTFSFLLLPFFSLCFYFSNILHSIPLLCLQHTWL
jgi:uncharacterized membrane protein